MGIEELQNMRKLGNRFPPKDMHTQIIDPFLGFLFVLAIPMPFGSSWARDQN